MNFRVSLFNVPRRFTRLSPDNSGLWLFNALLAVSGRLLPMSATGITPYRRLVFILIAVHTGLIYIYIYTYMYIAYAAGNDKCVVCYLGTVSSGDT